MKNQGSHHRVAYFIDFSIQEIPSIAPIALETGGTIFTNSELTYNCFKQFYPELDVAYLPTVNEIRTCIKNSNIQVILYPDYHIRYFRNIPGVRHVQVFHGTSDKSYDFQKSVLDYDLFFIPGSEAYDRYKKKDLLKKGTGRLIGYPKLDRVFRGELRRDTELEKIGLDVKNETVLYAPTWVDRAGNSSWKKFRKAFFADRIPENLNIIIKLHPNLKRYRENEVEELKTGLENRKNTAIFDKLPDIVPLMAASDLLAGDVSAVTREFLAFRRPFVFLSNRPSWLWNKNRKKLWECGEVVTSPEHLWQTVFDILKGPERYKKTIERHFEKTFYKPDGNAAKRAADAVFKLIEK